MRGRKKFKVGFGIIKNNIILKQKPKISGRRYLERERDKGREREMVSEGEEQNKHMGLKKDR